VLDRLRALLDHRFLSRLGNLRTLVSVVVAGLLVVIGLLVAVVKLLTDAGWVPLLFMGLALLVLLLVGIQRLSAMIEKARARRAAPTPSLPQPPPRVVAGRQTALPSRREPTRQAAAPNIAVQTEPTEQPESIDPKLRKWLDHERERGSEYAAHAKREGQQLLRGNAFLFALKNFGSSMSLSSLTAQARTWSRAIAARIEGVQSLSAHVETFREAPPPSDPDPTEGDFRRLAEYLEHRVGLLKSILDSTP